MGGCAGTGDGDVMMRFSPSFAAVMYMQQGEYSIYVYVRRVVDWFVFSVVQECRPQQLRRRH